MQTISQSSNDIFSFKLESFLALYFLQGLPYGIQTRFLPAVLRASGMSLTSLGYFRMLLAPWILKGLWAPIIDKSGDLLAWLNASHIALVILSLIVAKFPPEYFFVLGALLFCIHLSVAVQDIALDGLLIELLSPSQLVLGNMIQVVGYKLGSIFSGGFFGFFTEVIGWETLFYIQTLMFALGYIVSAFFLPNHTASTSPPRRAMGQSMSIVGFDDTNSVPMDLDFSEEPVNESYTFFSLLDIEGTTWLLLFVFVYKFGDQGLSSMFPMFMIDRGIDMAEVSFWSGCVGQLFSILGSISGGLIRKTMINGIQILLVIQAMCLLVLWMVVVFWDNVVNFTYVGSIFVLMIAYMASGGITTCTFTLIMQLSKTVPRRYRTQHYTLLATSEVAGRLVAGSIAGILTDETSYIFTFGLMVVVSVLIIPFAMCVPQALVIE